MLPFLLTPFDKKSKEPPLRIFLFVFEKILAKMYKKKTKTHSEQNGNSFRLSIAMSTVSPVCLSEFASLKKNLSNFTYTMEH